MLSQSSWNKPCVLTLWLRVFVSNSPYTTARDDPSVPGSKAAMLPQNELSVGSMPVPIIKWSVFIYCQEIPPVHLCHSKDPLIQANDMEIL
ncbi:MAG: hypothetical protein AB2693_26610 [Candidatus Thiodiazotropha sp.]